MYGVPGQRSACPGYVFLRLRYAGSGLRDASVIFANCSSL
jgi:hypothetical protein